MYFRYALIATAIAILFTMAALVWIVFCLAAMPNSKPGPWEWAIVWVPPALVGLGWIGVITLWTFALRVK